MARAIVVLLIVCCTADAAHAFRWPWIFLGHRRGHYYRHYSAPKPFDCDKVKAAMLDITPDNWEAVKRTLTEAQINLINRCLTRP